MDATVQSDIKRQDGPKYNCFPRGMFLFDMRRASRLLVTFSHTATVEGFFPLQVQLRGKKKVFKLKISN